MNALAIHLYLTITFINLVIIRLAQNYRIIESKYISEKNALQKITLAICNIAFF